jgi:hypothetical protein
MVNNSPPMNPRPTLEITLLNRLTGEQSTLRLLAKPCRNLRTRYWVVLPARRSNRERWFMEPSVAAAVQRASAWLHEQALAFFSLSPEACRKSDWNTRMAQFLEAQPELHARPQKEKKRKPIGGAKSQATPLPAQQPTELAA